MTFLLYLTFTLFVLICLILMMLVLIQKGRGGGLASAFGGGGGNTAFGSKTGDVLTWATSIVFGVFLILGVALNLIASEVNERKTGVPVPAAVEGSSLPEAPLTADPGVANPATARPILPEAPDRPTAVQPAGPTTAP